LPEDSASSRLGYRPWSGLAIAVVIIFLDQWSKQVAVAELVFGRPYPVTSWFDWMLAYNTGAAFSFLADAGGWQRWFLTAIAAGVSIFIVVWLFRLAPEDRALTMPLGLILGGGIGNLIDRATLGYVVDFVSWHYQDWYWPAFNVADAAISLGAAIWLWLALLSSSGRARDASSSEGSPQNE
jgi:signal peptidase II